VTLLRQSRDRCLQHGSFERRSERKPPRARPLRPTTTQGLIHFAGGFLLGTRSDQTGWNASGGATSWHSFQHNTACPYLGASTNFNVTEDASASPNHNALANLWMAVALYFASSPESYPLEHGDTVLDDCGLADHNASAVVDHYAPAKLSGGIDVDAKDQRHPVLKIERQGASLSMYQCVSKPISLNGLETFIEQQSLEGRATCGIAFAHSDKISTSRDPDLGIIDSDSVEYLSQQHRWNVFAAEPLGKNVTEGILKTGLVKRACMGEATEDGLLCG
jgi:hypothetical protein